MSKPHTSAASLPHPLHALTMPAHADSAPQRVARACQALRQGRPVLLQDDADREDEADLILPAQGLTVSEMARMIRDGSGIVCLCLPDERCRALDLPPMVAVNSSQHGTGFTVSIEARTGVTTGVSAADRVRTIQVACDPASTPQDLARPGHVFPLRARPGGLLERRGHTEGALALMALAGLAPAAVLVELMTPDGRMAKGGEVPDYARREGLVVLSIDDLVAVMQAPAMTEGQVA